MVIYGIGFGAEGGKGDWGLGGRREEIKDVSGGGEKACAVGEADRGGY